MIARNSTFTYKGQAVDVKRVGRELGVRYVLEGSVRKGGNRVRITGQLIDADTGAHLWADRFDGALEDVFDLQDRVASSVAGVIEPALQAAETARSARRPMHDSTAYDLYLRAYELYFSSATRMPEVLSLMERAVERDPYYGPALALNASCYFRMCLEGRSKNPEEDRRKAISLAKRALQAGGDDPGILTSVAVTLAYFGEEIGAMTGLAQRALSINPNFARGWHVSGMLKLWAGELDEAIQDARTALRLSPRARMGNTLGVLGRAFFLSRRFDEAIPNLLLAIQEDPDFSEPYRTLAACYAHMGRLREAAESIEKLKRLTPAIMTTIDQRRPEHRELFLVLYALSRLIALLTQGFGAIPLHARSRAVFRTCARRLRDKYRGVFLAYALATRAPRSSRHRRLPRSLAPSHAEIRCNRHYYVRHRHGELLHVSRCVRSRGGSHL